MQVSQNCRKICPLRQRLSPWEQQRRPPPAAETGRSCWGSGQQDASDSVADAGTATRAMSPKVTERARTLPKNKSTAITSALTKADIIAVQLLSEDGLALSVIASQCHLSQRERLFLFVQGERLGQGQHAGGDVVFLLVVVPDAVGDAVRDDLHLGLAHAPGGDGGSAHDGRRR